MVYISQCFILFLNHSFMNLKLLAQIYQHPDLQPEDLEKIFAAHKKVFFKKGDFLLKAGQIAQDYYGIEKGLLRSYVLDYQGNEVTTAFFSEAEIAIDVVSLFQRAVAKENIQTLTDCVAWKINYEQFQHLYHTLDAFSEWGRGWMTQSLFQFKQRSLAMITETAKDRYLALQSQHPQIVKHAPLKYIATYLGITDTSLSRIRNEIAKINPPTS
jgi:CRP/FNR family transcriptional regulator, anaerobic regulatory protein